MFCIERVFEDNEHYNNVFGEIGDAYVEAIGWLFTDKAYKDERNDYCLKGVMTTTEFMSCVKYFISAAISHQPQHTLNDYITQLRTGINPNKIPSDFDHNKVIHREYKGKDTIIFSQIEYNIIETFIWCAYIFWLIRSLLDKDRKSLKAKEVLLKAFEEHSFLTKEALKKHFLLQRTKMTLSRFFAIMAEYFEEEDLQSNNNESITGDKETEVKPKDSDCIKWAILATYNKFTLKKKEFSLFYLVTKGVINKQCTQEQILSYINESGISEQELPSLSSLKALTTFEDYPNWNIQGINIDEKERFNKIAEFYHGEYKRFKELTK